MALSQASRLTPAAVGAAPSRAFSSAAAQLPSSYVSVEWLKDAIQEPHVKVVDASWNVPLPQGCDSCRSHYQQFRIPGARFFDIDTVNDQSECPNMLPTAEEFSKHVGGELGISEQDTIIVYDNHGMFSAPRAWWSFRVFGAKSVAILRGGFPAWKKAGYEIETGEPQKFQPAEFKAVLQKDLVRCMQDVQENVEQGKQKTEDFIQMFDARGAPRFEGTGPEIRPGMSGGHIPLSCNIPFTELLQVDPETESAVLKPQDELLNVFQSCGVDLEKPVITTCGSGITACVLAFGLHNVGKTDFSVYDGSWSEWAMNGGEVWTGKSRPQE